MDEILAHGKRLHHQLSSYVVGAAQNPKVAQTLLLTSLSPI